MTKHLFKKLDISKAYRLLNSGPVVLITTQSKFGKPNIMALAWLTVVNSEPSVVAICVGEQAYSQILLLKTGEFAINIPDMKLLKKVVLCGEKSGSDFDKFTAAKLTKIKSRFIKPPKIGECFANLECRVTGHKKFGDVVMFTADVLYCEVKINLFDGYLKTDKVKTIHHLGGGWFVAPGKRIKLG